nr:MULTISPECIES: MFS transporter [Pseudomonas]
MLIFPQLAQTLYSPALTDFAAAFSVRPEKASQALTVYLVAFAFGVMGWGYVCDRIGRRPAMLSGLALYVAATVSALFVETFTGLLVALALAALGAAVGSVVTQTMLRDRFSGAELAKAFSLIGMALAVSPAIGLFLGAELVQISGYKGVLLGLLALSTLLWVWSALTLPETRPVLCSQAPLASTFRTMFSDRSIWFSASLVTVFNVAMMSYYAVAPFEFQRMDASPELYGYSGVVLAMGASLGAWLNRQLLKNGADGERLIAVAAVSVLVGGVGVQLLQGTVWFLLPMLLVVVAFGIAIPNVLGTALVAYGDRLGTAGAVFGLMYYFLIGMGMLAVGYFQALGATLIFCGCLAVASYTFRNYGNAKKVDRKSSLGGERSDS